MSKVMAIALVGLVIALAAPVASAQCAGYGPYYPPSGGYYYPPTYYYPPSTCQTTTYYSPYGPYTTTQCYPTYYAPTYYAPTYYPQSYYYPRSYYYPSGGTSFYYNQRSRGSSWGFSFGY